MQQENIPNLQMILLRKHISQLPREAARLLTSFLSTSYAASMVAQGWAALQDHELRQLRDTAPFLSTIPPQKVAWLCTRSSLLLEEIQNLSESVGQVLSALEDVTR